MGWNILAALSVGALVVLSAAAIAASKASLPDAAGKAGASAAPVAFVAAVFSCGPNASAIAARRAVGSERAAVETMPAAHNPGSLAGGLLRPAVACYPL
jgi:hypothetical protein